MQFLRPKFDGTNGEPGHHFLRIESKISLVQSMKRKSLVHVFSTIRPREPKPMNARICGEGGLALIPALCPLVENVYLWLLGLVHASQAGDKTWSHRHALG